MVERVGEACSDALAQLAGRIRDVYVSVIYGGGGLLEGVHPLSIVGSHL